MSVSRYWMTFPAWKNVKYQYGQGAKCSGTNTGVFHSQACTFPEESFILSIPCNSVCTFNWPAQAELQPITWRDHGQRTIFADFSWPAGPMISTEVECSFSLFSLVVSPPMTTTRVELSFSKGHTFYRINNINNHFLVFSTDQRLTMAGSLGPRLLNTGFQVVLISLYRYILAYSYCLLF